MEDRVSREAKLAAAKDLTVNYIRSSVKKRGEDQELDLSVDDACEAFRKFFDAVDATLPNRETKVGLGM